MPDGPGSPWCPGLWFCQQRLSAELRDAGGSRRAHPARAGAPCCRHLSAGRAAGRATGVAAFRTRVRPRGTGFWEPGNVPPSPARGRSRARFPGRLQASLLGQCAEVDAAGRILGDIGSVSVPTVCCCRWTSNERRGRGAERGSGGQGGGTDDKRRRGSRTERRLLGG